MRKPLILALLTLAALLPATPPAHAVGGGFFNLHCKLSHRAKDDPIVFPGVPGAAHLHDFFGNKSTNAYSTRSSMLQSGTTCDLSSDKAGYWAPTLLDKSGNPAPLQRFQIYYRSASGLPVQPFPPNLKIIAGGDTLNPPAPSRSQRSLSWSCGDTQPYVASPPDCSDSGMKVTGHILFPDCLKTGVTDSANHRSHMTYGGRNCPSGYVAVPRLNLHIRYAVSNAKGYALSSDMPGMVHGQSLHADFWNTWDQKALEFLVQHCLNGGRKCAEMTDAKLADMGFSG